MLPKDLFKLLLFTSITPLILSFVYGCSNKEMKTDQRSNDNEIVRKIESVAALGQLSPLGDVRKLAAPTSGKGGTPRLSKLLVKEGESIVRGQILAVFDNRPKLKAELAVEVAKLNILINEIRIQQREINRWRDREIQR